MLVKKQEMGRFNADFNIRTFSSAKHFLFCFSFTKIHLKNLLNWEQIDPRSW